MMKRTAALLLAALLILIFVPAFSEGTRTLVMVYMCGSDLESEDGQASDDLREMIRSGAAASGRVEIIAAVGGAHSWQRYGFDPDRVTCCRLEEDGPRVTGDLGRVSMGSADTLARFLEYASGERPDDRLILVMWDHGGGPVYGLCYDENFDDDALSLTEMGDALSRGLHGRRLDVIAFDACLMNCLETLETAAPYADYIVSSQESVTGRGLDYRSWLGALAADPSVSASDLAFSAARTYVSSSSKGRYAESASMSVVDSEKVPALTAAAEGFSRSLTKLMEKDLSPVIRLRSSLKSFGEFIGEDASDLIDIAVMCDAFGAVLPKESEALLKASREAVALNCVTDDLKDHAYGISFFMPYSTARSDRREILSVFDPAAGARAALVTAMTKAAGGNVYAMTAAAERPDAHTAESGAFGGIWSGYGAQMNFGPTAKPAAGGIWSGLPLGNTAHPGPSAGSAKEQPGDIWAGLTQAGPGFYGKETANANVVPGISEALDPGEILASAEQYFASVSPEKRTVFTLRLTREDLDHLSSADGMLFARLDGEKVCLGTAGETLIDWGSGLIVTLFDGEWPLLNGVPVRAEHLYDTPDGARYAVPVRLDGTKMYLIAERSASGTGLILGAAQGYDGEGRPVRGGIEILEGMTVEPLLTVYGPSGNEREVPARAVTVGPEGLKLTWAPLPGDDYSFAFALRDLTGAVQVTDMTAW